MNGQVIKRKQDWFILFIFLAALFIRIAYIFQILQFPLTEYLTSSNTFDQHGFDSRALFIASGNWLGGSEVFGKEPLYSYFLAVIYKIFGHSHLAVYIIQSLLTSLAGVLLYRITCHTFNRASGYIASIILAFYSISIFYDALLLRASLLTFLNILLLYLLVKARKTNGNFFWFASGVILGLSMITRHNLLLPFILIFIFLTARSFKDAIKSTLIFIIGFFLVLSPVLLRNYFVSGYKTVRISKEINAFWVGNAYNSSGIDFEPSSPKYRELGLKSEGSIRKSAYLFFYEIKKRPKEYLKLYARKIWMFFNGYEAPSNTNYYLYREEFSTILEWPLFNFRLICALGILGIALSLFRHEKPYFAYILLIILSSSVVLFHIQSRFRLPVVPFFMLFASYAVYFIFDRARNRDFMKSISIMLLAIFFYMIFKPDLTYAGFTSKLDMIRTFDRTNLALAYIDSYHNSKDPNDLKAALRQCGIALSRNPGFSTAYRIRGYVYFLEKKYDMSISEYKKALVYRNRNPFLYNELAGVYYGQKAYKKADLYIKRALHLLPGDKIFERNLHIMSETKYED